MENKQSNFLRDFLLILLSVILSITGIIVANNLGLIKLNGATQPSSETTTQAQDDLTKAVAKARACSVSVFCQLDSLEASAGSGVIFKYDEDKNLAYVMTNHHVVNEVDKDEYQVVLCGTTTLKSATLIGTDPENDIAILAFTPSSTPAVAEFGRSLSSLKAGETAIAIGNPLGYYDTVTIGEISTVGRVMDTNGIEKVYIQTSAPINPGNSGGGLFDGEGRLLGINTLSITSAQAMGFALPIVYDTTVSLSTTTYNTNKRDAISSFNCLLKSNNELTVANAENKIGFITGQKTLGATFETLQIIEKDFSNENVYVNNVYVDSLYDYFNVETGTGLSNWSEPTTSSGITTIHFIQKVETSSNGTTWQVGQFLSSNGIKTLIHNASNSTGVQDFSSVDLEKFISSKAVGTYFRFTIKSYTLNNSTGNLSEVAASEISVVSVLRDFQYQTPPEV